MNFKISYTPYSDDTSVNDKFVIPESSFLNPVKINDQVAEEVVRHPDDTASLVTSPAPSETPTTNNENVRLNLTWARKATSQPIVVGNPSKNTATNTNVTTPVKTSNLNLDDIKHRQMMAESAGNTNAVSRVGAKGLYQIMDGAHKDYVAATGNNGDLFDPKYNTKVRDWYMDWLGKSKIINTEGVSDFTKMARQLVAYNWGIGNLQKLLDKHRANGVDVDNSLDWLEGLPKETRDYVDKILLKNYSMNNQTA